MYHHATPPEVCVVLLLIALTVDLLSVGPGSVRDRIAFLIALPALYAGWAGEPLALWVTSQLTALTGIALTSSGSAYVASASPAYVVSALVAAAWVYAVGAVLPRRAQRWVGPIARFDLRRGKASMSAGTDGGKTGKGKLTPGGGVGDAPKGARLNVKLWVLAFVLALVSDLPQGAIGIAIGWMLGALITLTAGLPAWLIGAAR